MGLDNGLIYSEGSLLGAALWKGPCDKELKPPANSHVSETGSGNGLSIFRECLPGQLLEHDFMRLLAKTTYAKSLQITDSQKLCKTVNVYILGWFVMTINNIVHFKLFAIWVINSTLLFISCLDSFCAQIPLSAWSILADDVYLQGGAQL